MRSFAIVVVLASVAPLCAQSTPDNRITHTYTLGGDGSWDYIVPDPPNHRLFIGRQNRVMVVDENNGTLLGEVTGIQGAHGTARRAGDGAWVRDVGQRPIGRHVRPEDLQGAGTYPRCRRCRCDHLRRRVKSRVHLQWRRALVNGDRSAGGTAR